MERGERGGDEKRKCERNYENGGGEREKCDGE